MTDEKSIQFITASEIYVILNALKTRLEWAEGDNTIPEEEPHLKTAIDKFEALGFIVEKSGEVRQG